MTITTHQANSFQNEILQGIHTPTDTYKILLIKTGHTGNYGQTNTNVGTPGTGTPGLTNVGTDEVGASGTGYPAGGITLGAPQVTQNGAVSRWDFASPAALSAANFSADGAIIYNSTKGGRILATLAFPGAPIVVSGGNFTLNFPVAGDSTSLLRVTSA